jgi:hypothetical protein
MRNRAGRVVEWNGAEGIVACGAVFFYSGVYVSGGD